jgi:hypothetical protein
VRVEVSPPGLSAVPGRPATVKVTVTNTGTVISGHALRALGLDPSWVTVSPERLSLFPDASGEFTITLLVPKGLPAGARTLDIEIRELTPPNSVSHVRFELTIPAEESLEIKLDPTSVTGGRAVEVGVSLENTGNTERAVELQGADEEGAISFVFRPERPTLAPGERLVATAKLRARRRWFGSPKVRPFTVAAGPSASPTVAFGAWAQKPRLTRGNLSLMGLVIAITVFAIVISATLSQVVDQSNANRTLALQVAEASQNTSTGGTSALSGVVTLSGTNGAVSGVTVDLYTASNTAQPIVSTATGPGGAYGFRGLAAGSYKLSFVGAGFVEMWYPASTTASGAGLVTVSTGQNLANVDIRLGGQPASISGQVVAAQTTGATVSLELGSGTAGAGTAGTGTTGTGTAAASTPTTTARAAAATTANAPVIVATTTLSSSGSFTLANVPSPAIYDLVVNDPGYAVANQELNLSSGQNRSGVLVTLHKGDGSVSGTVSSAKGPIGGATVTATSGTTSVTTVTATTKKKVGQFLLASLPTPTTLTLQVSAPGYASQTLTVTLAAAQQVTGIAVTLLPGVGSISGTVATPSGTPAGGVTVTVSNGSLSLTTATLSTGKTGSYELSGLPVPGTYTVTFSRPDLASQTQAVSLGTAGSANAHGVDASMVAQTATVTGTVSNQSGTGVGGVAIALVSGSQTYQTTSATAPKAGAYEIGGVAPGTYNLTFTRQGGVPTSVIVHLGAGQRLVQNETLTPAASIYGYVVLAGTSTPVPNAQVNLYLSSAYPTAVTATATTNSAGEFTFTNVAAPQSFIVAVSYPSGSSPQQTIYVSTTLGAATPVCGSAATGQTTTSTTSTSTASTSPSSSSSSSTPPTNAPSSSSSSSASCTASSDPITVSVS